jgi:N6-L-threonylcarbamoyladenine synthase
MFEANAAMLKDISIDLVAVSEKPEAREESYMPVFMAGYQFARALSAAFGCPLMKTTHQAGHIRACLGTNLPPDGHFKAFHLSGGTHKLLDVEISDTSISTDVRFDTIDITAGQLIDRIGVALGYGFPAGKQVDEAAQQSSTPFSITRPKIKSDFAFSYSGALTYLKTQLGCRNKSDISRSLLSFIAEDILLALAKAPLLPGEVCLLSGGVSASKTIRDYLAQSALADAIRFTPPAYATDNAVGVAFIGADSLNKTELI